MKSDDVAAAEDHLHSAASRETMPRPEIEMVKVTADRDALAGRLADLETVIADERSRPVRQLGRHVVFRLLRMMSHCSPPLPQKTALRFASSAQKRSPFRSLAGHSLPETTSDGVFRAKSGYEYAGGIEFDPRKPNILVVSHQADHSGAPILALNLVQTLCARYNVFVLVLRLGPLLPRFQAASIAVFATDRMGPAAVAKCISELCRRRPMAFAIINTAESRATLQSLRSAGVATVSLIHEFATYVRPTAGQKSPFQEIFQNSSQVVFSTRLTLEAAQAQNPAVDMSSARILAQGKCQVPIDPAAANGKAEAQVRLRAALRPDYAKEKPIVVIGAGSVILRKGVDLFIEAATRVLTSPGAENVQFYWIGSGYDPDRDHSYSVYLRDQLWRAGIEDRVTMLRETTEIELAYALADVFVLSSRLDPLPNVAIDALSVGLPVVCFDKTTGIADLLSEAGLRDACVARYLDTRDLADKVLALATNGTLRQSVSQCSKNFATTAFSFDSYARKLENWGAEAASKSGVPVSA